MFVDANVLIVNDDDDDVNDDVAVRVRELHRLGILALADVGLSTLSVF